VNKRGWSFCLAQPKVPQDSNENEKEKTTQQYLLGGSDGSDGRESLSGNFSLVLLLVSTSQ
jgi:hypothetical protein